MIPGLTKRRMLKETKALNHAERLKRFSLLMENSFSMMSKEGYNNFLKRNHHKRRMMFKDGKWHSLKDTRNA